MEKNNELLSKLPSTGSPNFMLEIKLIIYLLSTLCPRTDLPKDSFRQLFAKAGLGSCAEKLEFWEEEV